MLDPSITPHPASGVAHHTDEDYINRSLLDSLDAQADAEPVSSSDSEAAAVASFGSSSNSSSGSPSVPYHIAVQAQHTQRPDSPSDPNQNPNHLLHHLSLKPSQHNSDPLYNLHSQNSQAMYSNSILVPTEYTSDHEGQKQHSAKPNGFGLSAGVFRPSASYTNGRVRHQTTLVSPQYHDVSASFTNSYPTATDVFAPSLSHLTSPTQPQHLGSHNFDAQLQGRAFDFASQPSTGISAHSKHFGTTDTYSVSAGLLQPHHVASVKSSSVPHHQLNGFTPTNGQVPYPAGLQIHSQTPYGPHLQTNGLSTSNSGANAGSGLNQPNSAPPNSSQEEISTIFVVGFPEDMQEREFQNMFTFSTGFEAATLKIPNKEYTAYNGTGAQTSASSRPGIQSTFSQGYGGSNDPYNLVTVHQGGVVVDGGRDGTMASWPTSVSGIPHDENSHFMSAGGSVQSMPPRKQIIGFAKFRSRAEALEARDILQGRRVDIEKGAVLKAEMAKKNLHTKRGVGPLQLPSSVLGTGGLNGGLAGMTSPESLAMMFMNGGSETITARERELGTLGAMGLGGMGQWRETRLTENGIPRSDEEDREKERRRDREAGVINAMGLSSSGTRGPRERAEEDERERRRKEKEVRLRSTNSTAYEAFHSVPPQVISRHASNALLSPSAESATPIGSGTSPSPMMGNGYGPPGLTHSSVAAQDEINGNDIGPWDIVDNFGRLSMPVNPRMASSRPRSPSQRSSSPPNLGQFGPSLSHRPSRMFSPPPEQQQSHPYMVGNEDHGHPSSRSESSFGGGSQSGCDSDGPRVVSELAVSTNNGNTSPQLPSPASGASSNSIRNAVDQNPPINTLYVGNLPTSPVPSGYPPNFLEESLRELFQRRPGFRKLCFRQKSNGPMCFVEFEDVSFATKTLNDLYGNTLNGLIKGGGIRLSYSKNPLGVRTPTSASSNGHSMHQQGSTNGHQVNGTFLTDAFQPRQSDVFQPRKTDSFLSRQSEVFQPRQSMDIDLTRVSAPRRESAVAASPPYSYAMASPPPRFFSPTSSSTTFGPSSNGLVNSSSSFPRMQQSLNGYSNAVMSTFSPFSLATPPHSATIPDQNGSDPHELHFAHHRDLSPSAASIEAARAG